MRLLIDARVTVDHAADDGRTGLITACQNGHEQVVRDLLEAGADQKKEIPGYSGRNAFKLAEFNGHTAVCDLLRK